MGFFMPFFLLIIFFLFVPFFQMLAKSFSTGSGQLGFSWYVEIFTKTSYLVAIKNSIWIAICSTILGTVIDFLLALSLTNAGKRNRTSIDLSLCYAAWNRRRICFNRKKCRYFLACQL